MKHLQKVKKNNIIKDDLRFDYKALKSPIDKKRPNSLPLFWQKGEYWLPIYELDGGTGSKVEFDALVYSENTSYEEILWEILKTDDLNVFDMTNSIQLLEKYAPAYDKTLWSRRFKIGVEQWDKIKILNYFKVDWQIYFISKNVPLKRILHFSDHDLRELLAPLLTLNPGINVLEAIANLLSEIAHRQEESLDMIWKDLGVFLILENSDMQSALKLQTIRAKLYAVRYPIIARYRKLLNEHLARMPRTAGIDLFADQDFETPGIRLQADIRSRADIEKLQCWLKDQRIHLENIMDIQKGNEKNEQE